MLLLKSSFKQKQSTMKHAYIFILLGLLLGCSKESAKQKGNSEASQNQPATSQKGPPVSLPLQVTLVENEDAKERAQIKSRETELLAAKNYDALDGMAHEFRKSGACHPNGLAKLNSFYGGFELDDKEAEALWKSRLAALQSWTKAKPKSVTARVAYAHFLTDYAWKARGSGVANTVTEGGWKLFGERLQQAAVELRNLEGLDEQCPHARMVLSRILLGLGAQKPAYEKFFEDSIKTTPGYTGYYYRQAIYLLPRWFGEPGEWESALAKGADKIGGDEGDMLYARVVWLMYDYNVARTNMFKEYNLSPARVDNGFQLIQKQFPDSLSVKSKRAHFACLSGNQKTARELFDSLGGKVDLTVWKSEQKFQRFAEWVYR